MSCHRTTAAPPSAQTSIHPDVLTLAQLRCMLITSGSIPVIRTAYDDGTRLACCHRSKGAPWRYRYSLRPGRSRPDRSLTHSAPATSHTGYGAGGTPVALCRTWDIPHERQATRANVQV